VPAAPALPRLPLLLLSHTRACRRGRHGYAREAILVQRHHTHTTASERRRS
jgi:hypothetical protein